MRCSPLTCAYPTPTRARTWSRSTPTADRFPPAAGIILRRGVRAALVGRPNVGKSSLLNALLRQNRAIVTPVPGTTRDTLEESAVLGGIPFVLVDTAGFNETPDLVEVLGIERS